MSRRLTHYAVSISILAFSSPGFGRDGSVADAAEDARVDAKPAVEAGAPSEGGAGTDGATREAGVPKVDSGGSADGRATLPSAKVGGACERDADCPKGLLCLTSSSNKLGGGGPAGGLCTYNCFEGGQPVCDAVDPGSVCFAGDKAAYCFEGCVGGPPPTDGKCSKRVDMACSPANAGLAYCKPTCRGDYDCGNRHCDPVTGLCVDSVSGTLPIGSACDPSAATTDCRGTCLFTTSPASTDNSMCTALCTLDVPGACGVDPSSSNPPGAACLITVAAGEGAGDVGACAQLCDCDSDCKNPSFVCQPVPAGGTDPGRPGMCVPKGTTDVFGQLVQHLTCGASGNDAGTPKPRADAGSNQDASAAPPAAKSDDSGCGCRVGERSSDEPGRGLVALSLALSFVARRRSLRR